MLPGLNRAEVQPAAGTDAWRWRLFRGGLDTMGECCTYLATGTPLGALRRAVYAALAVADAVLGPFAHQRGAIQRRCHGLQVSLLHTKLGTAQASPPATLTTTLQV